MLKTRLAILLTAALIAAGCGNESTDESTAAETTTNAAVAATTSVPATTTVAAQPAESTYPVTISAANGDVELVAMPTKIVSMSASHTEMLYAIGAGDQVVAVDAFSNYPPDVPVTDLTGFAPNIEAIVGLDTDLVVTDGDWDGSSMAALTELGVPVLILPAAATLDDVHTQIEQLGAATGHIAEAAALVGQMQTDVDEILASLPATDQPVTFYHELDATYYSVTSSTFIGQIYADMGLVNIADAVGDGSSGYPQLSEEYILEQDPDLILLADTICCDMSAESLAQRPGWDALGAVSGGAVVELNDDISSRWGPRIVDHMRQVAAAIERVQVNA